MSKTKFNSEEMSDEEQENLESSVVKKEKKKKTSEEKSKDRRVVFWVMLLIVVTTLGFWLKAYFEGRVDTSGANEENVQMRENGETEEVENGGFFVKYKI